MSDQSSGLHELPDLAGDVRDRVVIPPLVRKAQTLLCSKVTDMAAAGRRR